MCIRATHNLCVGWASRVARRVPVHGWAPAHAGANDLAAPQPAQTQLFRPPSALLRVSALAHSRRVTRLCPQALVPPSPMRTAAAPYRATAVSATASGRRRHAALAVSASSLPTTPASSACCQVLQRSSCLRWALTLVALSMLSHVALSIHQPLAARGSWRPQSFPGPSPTRPETLLAVHARRLALALQGGRSRSDRRRACLVVRSALLAVEQAAARRGLHVAREERATGVEVKPPRARRTSWRSRKPGPGSEARPGESKPVFARALRPVAMCSKAERNERA